MDKNFSIGMMVLSLMGIGMTFQMAEDTMNKDLDWMMEATLLDYVNPVAVMLCLFAFAISVGSLVWQKNKSKAKRTQDS